ncbi:MAG: hypothetical protein BroJett013_06650 [Alphaproteobacteria bacterium]|nr:MAG: hypothetical protein BroJett013_06650 [Alphaproteobacteria bacterium]
MGKGRSGKTPKDKNIIWRNGVAYARIQVNGVDRRRSLSTSDPAEARRKIKELQNEAQRERAGELSEVTFFKAAADWAKVGYSVRSDSTRERYATSLLMMKDTLGALRMHEITRRKIGEYVASRVDAGVTHATIKRDLTALSGLMRYCVARGWRDDNPAREWDRSTIPEKREPYERVDERSFRACVEEAPPAWGLLLRFLRASGFRLNVDALSLKRDAVGWNSGVVTFKTKRNRIRTRKLSNEALAILLEVPRSIDSPYIFWQLRGAAENPKLSRAFQDIERRAMRRAKREGWTYKRFHPHLLRHDFAIEYLKHGGPNGGVGSIYTLQGLLGHTSIKTTEIYLDYLTDEEVALAKEPLQAQNPAQPPRFSGADS